MTRYPLQALLNVARESPNQLRLTAGVSGQTWSSYVRHGVPERTAERLAVAAGLHPFVVWPSMTADVVDEHEQPCAYEECGRLFVPASHRQRYCEPRCRDRAKVKRWRASEHGKAKIAERRRRPDQAAKNRERRMRYYRENREYELARQRRYEQAKRQAKRQAS